MQLFFTAMAVAGSPEGLWQTFHPLNGLPRSHIRLEIEEGVLRGRIERITLPTDKLHPTCDWCEGDFRNAAFLGMIILDGLQQAASNPNIWSGGRVLDPDSGRVYEARIRLEPDGRSLQLRGYSGSVILGRSERWVRLASPK
jgi:uncharacterized protein (DUF2147 family)